MKDWMGVLHMFWVETKVAIIFTASTSGDRRRDLRSRAVQDYYTGVK